MTLRTPLTVLAAATALGGCLPIPVPVDDPVVEPVEDPAGDDDDGPIDDVAPYVLDHHPAAQDLSVSPDATIEVELSEAVDPDSLRGLRLVGPGGDVAGARDLSGSVVRFVPDAPLPELVAFTVRVTSTLLDLAGNPAEEAEWTFRTGDVTAPRVVDHLPADGAVDVPVGHPVQVFFDEAIDAASVTADTVRVIPDRPVDGVEHPDGLPGALSVDGGLIEWTPDRGALQEYGTSYVVVVDGVRDTFGNALSDGPFVSAFTTEVVDPGSWYRVRNAQFHQALDVFANNHHAHLAAPGSNTSGSYWHFTPRGDGWFDLRNAYTGAGLFLESNDGDNPSLMTGGGQYSGQLFELDPAGARAAGPGESPVHFHLESMFQGSSRSLGAMYEAYGYMMVGVEDEGWLDQKWYLVNEGPR